IHVISTEDDEGRGMRLGAFAVLNKPIKNKETLDDVFARIRRFIEQPLKNILVIGRPGALRDETHELVASLSSAQAVEPGAEALGAIEASSFACVVILPGSLDGKALASIGDVVRQCERRETPVIFYSPRPLSRKEESVVEKLGNAPSVKKVFSAERLLDQAALLLHRRMQDLPDARRQTVETLYEAGSVLAGKKVLIVDDDMRNIFALTSVLERQNMDVLSAETGREAIATLQTTPGIDIVLMDIMMPDMDGYETMRAIRNLEQFKSLPIIAVTAKAMKGDREKTLEAGAWDYLSKPVDSDQMLSVLRAWLYR
ncbi:MAG: response regulator, partial [Thermoanaerobaculia bacterium]